MRIAKRLITEEAITITVDGKPYSAYPGDTVASAIYATGKRAWHRSRSNEARGLFCGMGVCYDCLVTVDGVDNLRACQTLVRAGMTVTTNLESETL
ncbi:MAG: (2Fe-2S)-binding protein [Chloroflexi bacterium]|nr:(2Fe-2S)-binding protein [Chloroflexota bacterium]